MKKAPTVALLDSVTEFLEDLQVKADLTPDGTTAFDLTDVIAKLHAATMNVEDGVGLVVERPADKAKRLKTELAEAEAQVQLDAISDALRAIFDLTPEAPFTIEDALQLTKGLKSNLATARAKIAQLERQALHRQDSYADTFNEAKGHRLQHLYAEACEKLAVQERIIAGTKSHEVKMLSDLIAANPNMLLPSGKEPK